MSLKFTGRESQLTDIENLVKAKQGAVFAVSGNAGIGKSSLLKEVARRYPKTGQVFIDINDVPPLQTATEFLQFFAKQAKRLENTKRALAEINGTYKTTADLIAPYKEVFQQTTDLAIEEHQKNLPDDIKENVTTYAALIWKVLCIVFSLGMIYWKLKREEEQEKLKDPEKYFLDALKKDCANHPLIFIDTYERLQAAQELSQQRIKALYNLERLSPVGNKDKELSLQDWLERLIDFLTANGAIVLIAGRHISRSDWELTKLENFNNEEIFDVVRQSNYPKLKLLLDKGEKQKDLLSLLKRLSFDGIPLWLQLALNFVSVELATRTITELAALDNLEALFAEPLDSSELISANIDHASCKLALFERVMQHYSAELKAVAWKMALPRRLDKAVLTVLFADRADTMHEAFKRAGLLPSVRWEEGKLVSLHQEIRDLLLAYAKYKKWLETEETKALHQQLAELFAQRYQKNADIQLLLEQLYHQLMADGNADLSYIKQPDVLFDMAITLETEKQYPKMEQICLRLIEIQPLHERAWNGLGIALKNQGKLNEAIVAYQKQLEIQPNHERSWNGLANTLSDLGKLDEAIFAYRKQIEIKPNHELAWNNLGVTYWQQGHLSQAQHTLAKVLEINSQNILALSNDAELALIQQDKERCLQRIQQALLLVDNKTDEYAILPFLAWLIEPENSYQSVLTAIAQLDSSVKITWDFTDTEPAILRLTPQQQTIARQFIAYFQGQSTELPPVNDNQE